MTTGVAALIEDLTEQAVNAVQIFSGGELGRGLGRYDAGPNELPEADRDRLAEVHGRVPQPCVPGHGDGEERVAMAELFVGEAGLLGAEEQGDARVGVGKLCVDARRGFGKTKEGMTEVAFADRGCSEHQRTPEERVRERKGDNCVSKDLCGVDGGARCGKGYVVLAHEMQIEEAEVVHGASDCADVVGVAGTDEDDTNAGEGQRHELF